MSSYKISYEQLRQTPEIMQILAALERGFDKFSIDFYLVGAVARDVWMSGINKIAPRRTTADIDFAVLINNKETYEALKSYLINTEGFHPYKGNAYVLIWKEIYEVDLLPFGAIEDENSRVSVNGVGLTNISLQGFTEVYEEGLPQINIQDTHQFKFCTLPGIVLLKLIAWSDRPEVRRSDINDISDILNHFFDMHSNEIWENHNELFENEAANLHHIAAKVMGREMYKIAKRNNNLYNRINTILTENTNYTASNKMAAIMVEYFQNTIQDNVLLLQQLQQGFTNA